MRDNLLSGPIELKLPAQRNMMLVLRLTTAGVITRAGLAVDRMDDVKMAVEEACSCLIETRKAPENLFLRFDCEEDTLKIHICTGENCSGEAPDPDEISVIRCILEALVDSVEFKMRGDLIAAMVLRVKLSV